MKCHLSLPMSFSSLATAWYASPPLFDPFYMSSFSLVIPPRQWHIPITKNAIAILIAKPSRTARLTQRVEPTTLHTHTTCLINSTILINHRTITSHDRQDKVRRSAAIPS